MGSRYHQFGDPRVPLPLYPAPIRPPRAHTTGVIMGSEECRLQDIHFSLFGFPGSGYQAAACQYLRVIERQIEDPYDIPMLGSSSLYYPKGGRVVFKYADYPSYEKPISFADGDGPATKATIAHRLGGAVKCFFDHYKERPDKAGRTDPEWKIGVRGGVEKFSQFYITSLTNPHGNAFHIALSVSRP